MRKSAIHKITALTLAFLMLSTSTAFSIDIHYCKGELKSFSFIGEAQSCHTAKKTCPHHAKEQTQDDTKKECCTNETYNIDDLDADFNVSLDGQITELQLKFVVAYTYAFSDISTPKVEISTFLKEKDPIPARDIYVLLERFLI